MFNLKVTLNQPDTDCLHSSRTLPSGAQRAPQHNVKFHMAELPGWTTLTGPQV